MAQLMSHSVSSAPTSASLDYQVADSRAKKNLNPQEQQSLTDFSQYLWGAPQNTHKKNTIISNTSTQQHMFGQFQQSLTNNIQEFTPRYQEREDDISLVSPASPQQHTTPNSQQQEHTPQQQDHTKTDAPHKAEHKNTASHHQDEHVQQTKASPPLSQASKKQQPIAQHTNVTQKTQILAKQILGQQAHTPKNTNENMITNQQVALTPVQDRDNHLPHNTQKAVNPLIHQESHKPQKNNKPYIQAPTQKKTSIDVPDESVRLQIKKPQQQMPLTVDKTPASTPEQIVPQSLGVKYRQNTIAPKDIKQKQHSSIGQAMTQPIEHQQTQPTQTPILKPVEQKPQNTPLQAPQYVMAMVEEHHRLHDKPQQQVKALKTPSLPTDAPFMQPIEHHTSGHYPEGHKILKQQTKNILPQTQQKNPIDMKAFEANQLLSPSHISISLNDNKTQEHSASVSITKQAQLSHTQQQPFGSVAVQAIRQYYQNQSLGQELSGQQKNTPQKISQSASHVMAQKNMNQQNLKTKASHSFQPLFAHKSHQLLQNERSLSSQKNPTAPHDQTKLDIATAKNIEFADQLKVDFQTQPSKQESQQQQQVQKTYIKNDNAQQFQQLKHQREQFNQTLKQVMNSLKQATETGQKQLSLQLQPKELGTITASLIFNSDKSLNIKLSAEKTDTLQALKEDKAQLIKGLQDLGFNLNQDSFEFSDHHSGDNQQNKKEQQKPCKNFY